MGKVIQMPGAGGAPSQQATQQLDMRKLLETAKPVTCDTEGCGSETFTEAVKLKLISKIMTGQPQDTLVPIQVMVCTQCGAILPLTDPDAQR
jgi:hypothetical protein